MKNISAELLRLSAITLIAFAVQPSTLRASVIQSTATLPPPAGVYTLPTICIPAVCVVNVQVSGFNNTSESVVAGNELVTSDATFSALVYQNAGGSPGAFLGPLSAPGSLDFTFFGRTAAHNLGTFNAQITDFDFTGTFAGHTFEARQNPASPSTGQTTINIVDLAPTYQVTSFFDVFAELSLDGGTFIPGPPRRTVLTSATPEPATSSLLVAGLGLVGLAFVRRRRAS